MHFFNPAPVMALLEVVAGERSEEPRARDRARRPARAMGKTVIRASDGPGFLVNRCNRPFGLEALRLLAGARRLDRGRSTASAGWRAASAMGPFELMDLVGRGHRLRGLQELLRAELRGAALAALADHRALRRGGPATGARAAAATTTTRAPPRARHRDEDPGPIEAACGRGEGVVVISGAGALAGELRGAAKRGRLRGALAARAQRRRAALAGDRLRPRSPGGERQAAGSQAPPRARRRAPAAVRARLAGRRSNPGGSAVGFHALPPLGDARHGGAHARRELLAAGGRARGALLRVARQARHLGRRRSRPRARADRLPGHQRVRVRARRRASAARATSTSA